MQEFGNYLKTEREAKGFTLEQIEQETRIRLTYLQAIENGEFNKLPGEFYCRTYIRSYAKAIGLEEAEVIVKYENRVKEIMSQGETEILPIKTKWDGTLQETVASKGKAPVNKKPILIGLIVVVLLIIAGAIYLALSVSQPNNNNVENEQQIEAENTNTNLDIVATEEDPVIDSDLLAQVPSEVDTLESSTEKIIGKVDILVKAKGDCWFQVANTQEVIEDSLLRSGEEFNYNSQEPLIISLGKPQVVELYVNGKRIQFKDNPREIKVDLSGNIEITKRW